MTELQVFNNPTFGNVRVVSVNNEPYFVGKDVAEMLGYAKPLNALATHIDEDDSLKQGLIDSMGRMQETILINESGLYSLILSSKLPKAKEFKHWVTAEVLPAIRKTGGYTASKTKPKLGEVNSAARILIRTLKEAGMPAEYRAVALQNIYRPAGIDIPLIGITMPERYYNPTEIAEKLGIYSTNGKPHGQAVAGLISTFEIAGDDRVLAPFQNPHNGHTSQNWQYSERVMGMVDSWIKENRNPDIISTTKKNYSVTYRS